MIYRTCDNYYVYIGDACLENGGLEIKIAFTKEARNYMERVIRYLEQSKAPKKRKKKQKGRDYLQPSKKNQAVNYHCLTCHEEEKIPYDVVQDFDRMDAVDPTVPPQFQCENCGGEMIQRTIKESMDRNINYQMYSNLDI
uniref:hypothetical protein n=1 Tax=Oceanobacillus jeddahense TaxID=1462527 RepID=UPI001FCABDB4|nr:hypothetical protein [Oceanobacillus jeddahense]